jgi:hypothetical protein
MRGKKVTDLREHFWSKVERREQAECWAWCGAKLKTGYGSIRVDYRALRAHRVAFELEVGSIPIGLDVCHTCDNRICVNPQHLFLGTRKENMQDAKNKGRLVRGPATPEERARLTSIAPGLKGEDHPRAKLTWDFVRSVRARVLAGEKQVDLARQYNLNVQYLNGIIKGRLWKE